MQVFLTLLQLSLAFVACTPSSRDPGVEPPVPPGADRQAWDLRLDIAEPGLRVEILAPFIQEVGRSTRADSGAAISFVPDGAGVITRVQAGRMEFSSEFLALSGAVELTTDDSLFLHADSLLWARDVGEFWIPDRMEMRVPGGQVGGRNMKADLQLGAWSLEQTRETWWTGGDSLSVTAGRQTGRRNSGQIVVDYEDLTATFDGLTMQGERALYLEERGLLQFDAGVRAVDSTHSFRSGRMEYNLREQSFAATGEVSLLADSVEITASAFSHRAGTESFLGTPAEFRRGERTIGGSELSYDRTSGILRAREAVSFREGNKNLTSDRLIYHRETDSVAVEGSFSLNIPAMRGVAAGGGLQYSVRGGRATMTRRPTFRRERGDGSQLLISARTIGANLHDETLDCGGFFRAASKEAVITARSGLFEHGNEQLTLSGEVEFRMKATSDSIVTALRADSMRVDLEDGRLAHIEIPDSLAGSIAGGAGRINWISARGGSLLLQGDELERVELRGGSEVTHRKLGDEEVSRFAGAEMTMEFRDRIMQRVHVRGNAEVVSRIPKSKGEGEASMNRVEGERLVIEFTQGEITAVRLLDSIKGRYYPPEKREE